jgi:hypothetical protein
MERYRMWPDTLYIPVKVSGGSGRTKHQTRQLLYTVQISVDVLLHNVNTDVQISAFIQW